MILKNLVVIVIVLLSVNIQDASTNPDAKRLYDDLLSNYNRLIRPVRNHSTNILVKLGLRLSQLIELVSSGINIIQSISLKNVYMFWTELKGSNSYHQRLAWTRKFSTLRKTNNIQGVCKKKQEWYDYKFNWNPSEYGGVTELYVPSEHIWLPDILLYNKYFYKLKTLTLQSITTVLVPMVNTLLRQWQRLFCGTMVKFNGHRPPFLNRPAKLMCGIFPLISRLALWSLEVGLTAVRYSVFFFYPNVLKIVQ